MKRKGFTLIELLAVIVILAIIALIATPIIMNTISNSKKGAAERSTERYFSAVETMIATERLDNEIVADGDYEVQANGNLCLAGKTCTSATELKVEMNGNKPSTGIVTIENGQVVRNKLTTITIGEYTVSYDTNSKVVATEGSLDMREYSKIRTKYSTIRDVEKFIAAVNNMKLSGNGYYIIDGYFLEGAGGSNEFAPQIDYDGIIPDGYYIDYQIDVHSSIALEDGKVVRSNSDYTTNLILDSYEVTYNSNNELVARYIGNAKCAAAGTSVENDPYAIGTMYYCTDDEPQWREAYYVFEEKEDTVLVFGTVDTEHYSYNEAGTFSGLSSYAESIGATIATKDQIAAIAGGTDLTNFTWLQGRYWTATEGYAVKNKKIVEQDTMEEICAEECSMQEVSGFDAAILYEIDKEDMMY